MNRLPAAALPVLLLVGCAVRSPDYRAEVSRGLRERTGAGIGPGAEGKQFPPGVTVDDGLTEEEAVATALWNNAAFQADLAELGLARADLVEAGLLRNPVLSLLFPWGPKQLEATASWPVDALWQRPRRVAAAKLDAERVAQNLIQHGLDLALEVRVACAELLLARDRERLGAETARVRSEIAGLAEARLRAGDIAQLEVIAARAQAQRARESAARWVHETAAVRERLRHLLSLSEEATVEVAPAPLPTPASEPRELMKRALAARPDLRAAEIEIEAAGERAHWQRSRVLAIAPIVDINAEGKEGFEIGPGIQAEIPLFNRNQGGIARADAEVERATRRYAATRQRIVSEVREALTRLGQAQDALTHWRERILPTLEEAGRDSAKAYAAGDTSYLPVLEAAGELAAARMMEAETVASLRRAAAQLERSVGGRSGGTP